VKKKSEQNPWTSRPLRGDTVIDNSGTKTAARRLLRREDWIVSCILAAMQVVFEGGEEKRGRGRSRMAKIKAGVFLLGTIFAPRGGGGGVGGGGGGVEKEVLPAS